MFLMDEDDDLPEELFLITTECYYSLNIRLDDPLLTTGIMQDVLLNDKEAVLRKIAAGKSVRVVNNNGKSLLHLAVQVASPDDMSMIDLLLQQEETDINALDFIGLTPLVHCIYWQKPSVAIHLIKAGANVNYPADYTPLHQAIKYEVPTICEALIEAGADINATDLDGDTPLHVAIYFNKFEMMCLLLCYGALMLPNHAQLKPLALSLEQEKYSYADVLLDYEAEFDTATIEMAFRSSLYPSWKKMFRTIKSVNEDFIFKPSLDLLYSLLSRIDMFEYIWSNYRIECDFRTFFRNFFYNQTPARTDYLSVLNVIVKSNEFLMRRLVECSFERPYLFPLLLKFPSEDIHKYDVHGICAVLLSYGLQVWDIDLDVVHELCGNRELFKLLLHMDIKIPMRARLNVIPYLHYSINKNVRFHEAITSIIREDFPFLNISILRKEYVHLSRFTVLPQPEDFKISISSLGVPKLTELARNELRHNICVKYNTRNSRDFYTRLNMMPIANSLKRIISLETPLYEPVERNKFSRTVRTIRFELYKLLLADYKLNTTYENV